MGCLRLKCEQYKGQVIVMEEKILKKWKKMKKGISKILSIIGALGVIAIIVGFFMQMQNDINLLKQSLEKVDKMYNYIYVDENSINKQLITINNDVNNINDNLNDIKEALNIKVIAVTDTTTISSIDKVVSQNTESYILPVFLSDKPVGTDIYGKLYYTEDLINETMLLTYKENNKEVYFLGQYNDKYNWDGYCVTNTYNLDGTLYGICESNFDNGKRIDYKSLYSSDNDVWTFSNRTCNENINTGTNIEYTFDYAKVKNFTDTNVRRTDILYVENFIDSINDKKMKQFYCGETSNERYNDDSGNAYLVIYNPDQTVKTLYVGKFTDGCCEDSTGEAWSISYSDDYENYYYNTGKFRNNKAVRKSTTPITIDEIEQIISSYNFECKLKWKE